MSEQVAEAPVAEAEVQVAEGAEVAEVVAQPEGIQNPEAYEKALKSERESRKALEKELKAFREAEEERRREAMSDTERAIAEAKAAARAEVETEYKSQLMKSRVKAKAQLMGFHDPALVSSLVDLEPDASAEEIDEAVAEIAAARPYLVKPAVPNLPQGPRGGADGKAMGGTVATDDWFRKLLSGKS
jgi:hypothetical protein